MRASEVIVEWSWILDKSLPRDLDLVRVANIDKVVRYEAFFFLLIVGSKAGCRMSLAWKSFVKLLMLRRIFKNFCFARFEPWNKCFKFEKIRMRAIFKVKKN